MKTSLGRCSIRRVPRPRHVIVCGAGETTAQVTPARFTAALLDAAQARGARLRIGVVEAVAQRDGAVSGVITAGGETLEGDAVVLAMGPWTGRAAGRLALPSVYGL